MAFEEVVNTSTEILTEVGRLGKWLQALGLIVFIWIVFQLVNFYINRKKLANISKMRNDLLRIEDKLDKLIWKKSNKKKK